MNILIDARSLADEVGGIPQYTYSIIVAMAKRYREHRFLLFLNGYKETSIPQLQDISPNCLVVKSSVPNKLLNCSMRILGIPALDILTRRTVGIVPDVVFMPNINFAAVSHTVPIVLTIHDLSYYHYLNTFSWQSQLWHRSIHIASLIRRSKGIIAVSDHTRDEIIEHFNFDSDRVITVPHGLDWVEDNIALTKEQLGFEGEYMIAPGMGAGRKNLQFLLDAWSYARQSNDTIRNMTLVITGIKTGGHTIDGVLFVGTVPDETYRALMRFASAMIYPSRYEGYGFPIKEAFASQIPVIASSCSSIPEVGRDAYHPFDPYDVGSLVSAIHSICDRNIAKRFITAGASYSQFDPWDVAAEKTMRVINEVYETH